MLVTYIPTTWRKQRSKRDKEYYSSVGMMGIGEPNFRKLKKKKKRMITYETGEGKKKA